MVEDGRPDASLRVAAWARSQRPRQRVLGLFWAPGRVNLIGDHIDYLGGTVLPMSIDRGTAVLVLDRPRPGVVVHALDMPDEPAYEVASTEQSHGDWRDFVNGLLALAPAEPPDAGAELVVSGDLTGGGLSSSASFTLALAAGLAASGHLQTLQGIELAHLARRVEVERVGTACGLMDQLAIVHGSASGAVAIDCATAAVEPVLLELQTREFLLIHCGQERRLADGIYNARRAELAAGLEALGQLPDRIPQIDAQALPEALTRRAEGRRVRHVITEQARVEAARQAARAADWRAFGLAMERSHASLRDDFEVSIPPLDALVEAAIATPGCDGARLTGAGLGGWAVVLLESVAREHVLAEVARALGTTDRALRWFVPRPGGCLRSVPWEGIGRE